MIIFESTFNTEVLTRLSSAMNATPDIIQDVVVTDVQPVIVDYVDTTLAPYPPSIRPGVFRRHATPKQLRYVMAKIRRGEWTGRTGSLRQAWQTVIEQIPAGVILHVRNVSRVARYIVGDQQQGFHTETGWPVARQHVPAVHRLVIDSFRPAMVRRFVERLRG